MSTTYSTVKNYLTALSGDLRLIEVGSYFSSLLEGRSLRQIAQRISVPYRSLMNYMRDTRAMPLDIAFRIVSTISNNKTDKLLNQLFMHISWIKSTSSSAQPVKLPKTYSEALAYLIGAIHDGTVFANEQKNQYLVQYWQISDSHWLDRIASKLEHIFGRRPKRYESYVQFSSKPVYEFFAKVIKVPQRQGNWDSFLRAIPKKFQLAAIAGMFDAEGWVGNDLRLKLSQNNKKKLLEVKEVLHDHHIESGAVIRENSGHALWLCGKNCIDFATKVGKFCEHENKRSKLNNLI